MSVNDLVVQGAEPLFFLDYFACGKLEPEVGARVVQGRRRRLPAGRLRADRRRDRRDARPLSAAATTISPASRSAPPSAARSCRAPTSPRATSCSASPPPACIPTAIRWCARSSSTAGLRWDAPAPFDRPRRSARRCSTPTRIYVKSCLAAIRETKAVKALAHITGGGFPDNIPRVLPKGLGAEIDLARVPVLPVFQWLARRRQHRRAGDAAHLQLRHRHDRGGRPRARPTRSPRRSRAPARPSCGSARSCRTHGRTGALPAARPHAVTGGSAIRMMPGEIAPWRGSASPS